MIRVTVNSRSATVVAQTPVTSGAVGIPVEYSFSEDWDGVSRMAVFRVAGVDTIYDTLLGSDNKCVIPWELLDDYGKMLFVGAYGETEDGHLVIPTVWAEAGLIEEGAHAGTPSDPDPSPTQWTQIRTLAATAAEQATTAAAQATAANTAVSTALAQTAADRAAAEQAATAAAASQTASGQSATAAAGSASAAATSATEAAGSAAAAYQSEINAAAIAQGEVEAALVHYAKKAVIADVYSPASTYAVGDYCIYEDTLYICVTAITEAEAWTAAHWDAVSVSEMLKEHAGIIGTDTLSTTAQTLTGAINEHETDISGKVSKAGDTMSGDLILQNASCITQDTSITSGTTPSSNIYGRAFYLDDNQRFNIGTWQIMALTNGREGFQLVAGKKVNNVNKFNYVRILVDANGDPVVDLNGAAAWRSALGLTYAANDTFSVTSSLVLNGLIGSTAKTTVYLDCVVDRSMENISSISVTTMTGYLAGTNGRDTSGSTDYTGTGYTISCTKQGNHHVRIGLTKTSAFPMGNEFTPVTYFGTLTLKFT